jgi:hypothetical protein
MASFVSGAQGHNFSMGLADGLRVALAKSDATVINDDAADAGVGVAN